MPSRVRPYPVPRAATLGEAYELAAQQLVSDVIAFHLAAVVIDGGDQEIRDADMLFSAVYRPFMMHAGIPLYRDGLRQAAALVESLVLNHPFVDGNKRTAALAGIYFLEQCGYWRDVALLSQREAQAYEALILDIAQNHIRGSSDIMPQLDRILSPSRNRRLRTARLLSGAYRLLTELLGPHQRDKNT